MRSRLSPSFLAELPQASALGAFACVVVDGGGGAAAGNVRGCVLASPGGTPPDHVVLLTVPDTVGVTRACETLKRLTARTAKGTPWSCTEPLRTSVLGGPRRSEITGG